MRLLYILIIGSFTCIACSSKDKVSTNKVSNNVDELIKGDWFTAKCEALCDEELGVNLDIEKLKKYGQYNPYDITQVITNDSAIITFDVIANCCMDFAGGVNLRNDTLLLEYQPPHDSLAFGCDCSCDYRMVYRLNKKGKEWSVLKTVNRSRF